MMKNRRGAFALSMAVLWSIVFAQAMHDWTIGICMGLMMGMAFGLFSSDHQGSQDDDDADSIAEGEENEDTGIERKP